MTTTEDTTTRVITWQRMGMGPGAETQDLCAAHSDALTGPWEVSHGIHDGWACDQCDADEKGPMVMVGDKVCRDDSDGYYEGVVVGNGGTPGLYALVRWDGVNEPCWVWHEDLRSVETSGA